MCCRVRPSLSLPPTLWAKRFQKENHSLEICLLDMKSNQELSILWDSKHSILAQNSMAEKILSEPFSSRKSSASSVHKYLRHFSNAQVCIAVWGIAHIDSKTTTMLALNVLNNDNKTTFISLCMSSRKIKWNFRYKKCSFCSKIRIQSFLVACSRRDGCALPTRQNVRPDNYVE